jgi:membrane protein
VADDPNARISSTPEPRRVGLPDPDPPAGSFQRFVQFFRIVYRGFVSNRCPVRASALAYSNLLALVPVLAVAISISTGLLKNEGAQRIEQFIQQVVATITPETRTAFRGDADDPRMTAARKEIADRIDQFIRNTSSSTLGVTGMVALLFVGIGMLVRIEETLNDIWGVTQGRSWLSRVVHYWAAMTLGPVLLVAAIVMTGGEHLESTQDFLARLPLGVGKAITYCFRFLPFILLTATFTLCYQLMPHTRVDWRASLVGGLMAGTLWQANNLLSVFYASRVLTNSYIYGSLGLIPLVMVGLYFSWLILLFGAQVAYTYQNRKAYLQEQQMEHFNHAARELIALQVMVLAGRAFDSGSPPPSITKLAAALAVPSRLVTQVVRQLEQSRLLVETNQGGAAFTPARSLEAITCHDILSALRSGAAGDPADGLGAESEPSPERELGRIRQLERQAAQGVRLSELVRMPVA